MESNASSQKLRLFSITFISCKWPERLSIRCASNSPTREPFQGLLWAIEAMNGPAPRSSASKEALCVTAIPSSSAIGLRDMLQDILAPEDEASLRWWCKRAKLSRLEHFGNLAISTKSIGAVL